MNVLAEWGTISITALEKERKELVLMPKIPSFFVCNISEPITFYLSAAVGTADSLWLDGYNLLLLNVMEWIGDVSNRKKKRRAGEGVKLEISFYTLKSLPGLAWFGLGIYSLGKYKISFLNRPIPPWIPPFQSKANSKFTKCSFYRKTCHFYDSKLRMSVPPRWKSYLLVETWSHKRRIRLMVYGRISLSLGLKKSYNKLKKQWFHRQALVPELKLSFEQVSQVRKWWW